MEIELPVSFEGTMVPTYNEIQCGQTIMFFTAPDEMVDRMNKLYDEGKKNKTRTHIPSRRSWCGGGSSSPSPPCRCSPRAGRTPPAP